MSILQNIKVDVLIACHPTVLKFKREAKALHKQLKAQQITLMQCQEIVAQRNGFNNYHHFIQIIKKHYYLFLEYKKAGKPAFLILHFLAVGLFLYMLP